MMKRQFPALSQRYQSALQKHLKQDAVSRPSPALRLGRLAVTLGVETLDLARIHKAALTALVAPGSTPSVRVIMANRAAAFFADALASSERNGRGGLDSAVRLHRQSKTLTRQTTQLTAVNRQLKRGIIKRKSVAVALRKSGKDCATLVRDSDRLQKHLRHLTHQLLSAQEAERKKFSHELHDEVAQALLGVNVWLLTLKRLANGNKAKLTKAIASTQRVVEECVQLINRFTHELDIHQPA